MSEEPMIQVAQIVPTRTLSGGESMAHPTGAVLDMWAATTAGEVLQAARRRLEHAGADSPWLTALVLLEHVTGRSRVQTLAHPELELTPDQQRLFGELVDRRARREPLAYILGYRDFYDLRFRVTTATLIPRPETEGLVTLALSRMDAFAAEAGASALSQTSGADAPTFVDVGTGSGAIAVTLLASRPMWRGIATDVSSEALAVARDNATRHQVADRLDFRPGHLATGIERKFPLVVANLPYVPAGEIAALEPEVATFEPLRALDGGPHGTSLMAELIAALPALLLPGGSALFEFGYGQADELSMLARQALPASSASIESDAAGTDRYLVIDLPGDSGTLPSRTSRVPDPAAADVLAPSPARCAAGLSPDGGEAGSTAPSFERAGPTFSESRPGLLPPPLGEGWGEGVPGSAQTRWSGSMPTLPRTSR